MYNTIRLLKGERSGRIEKNKDKRDRSEKAVFFAKMSYIGQQNGQQKAL